MSWTLDRAWRKGTLSAAAVKRSSLYSYYHLAPRSLRDDVADGLIAAGAGCSGGVTGCDVAKLRPAMNAFEVDASAGSVARGSGEEWWVGSEDADGLSMV